MREVHGDWRDIFMTFRMALDARKMSLAFVGSAVSFAGIVLILFFTLMAHDKMYPESARHGSVWSEVRDGQWQKAGAHVTRFARVLVTDRPGARCRLRCYDGVPHCCPFAYKPTRAGWLMGSLFGVWLVFVWGFFGGAITRIAAVELAKDERMEFSEATRFAHAHYWSYVWSPLSVGVVALVIAVAIAAGGWACDATWNWGIGKALLVLGMPFAILGGAFVVLLALGGLFGCCLMFPAISAEGTDAFDAVSRAFSYVFSRPCHYLGYMAVKALYAIPSCAFVLWFAYAMVRVALCAGQALMCGACGGGNFGAIAGALPTWVGGDRDWIAPSQGGGLWLAYCLVAAVIYVVLGMAWSYIASYHFTANTVVYFLLRKGVDGTEMKEVYEEESEEDLVAGVTTPAPPASEPPKAG